MLFVVRTEASVVEFGDVDVVVGDTNAPFHSVFDVVGSSLPARDCPRERVQVDRLCAVGQDLERETAAFVRQQPVTVRP